MTPLLKNMSGMVLSPLAQSVRDSRKAALQAGIQFQKERLETISKSATMIRQMPGFDRTGLYSQIKDAIKAMDQGFDQMEGWSDTAGQEALRAARKEALRTADTALQSTRAIYYLSHYEARARDDAEKAFSKFRMDL